jgi:hypothetical protein
MDARNYRRIIVLSIPQALVFRVSAINLYTVSKYFHRLLDGESRRFVNRGLIDLTLGYTDTPPEVLDMVFYWVDNEQLLETHTLAEYKNIPAEYETSPWMRLIKVYFVAERFEIDGLKNTIIYKILDMCFATNTTPCGALKDVYAHTREGDGLRRLFIDLVAHSTSSTVYRAHFHGWTRAILQDLLCAVRDTHKEPLYQKSIERYLTPIDG